jgi:hypothetical protein
MAVSCPALRFVRVNPRRGGRCTLAGAVAALLLGRATASHANTPCAGLDWQLAAAPPFSRAELDEALRIRCGGPAGKNAAVVALRWAAPRVIEAGTPDRRRQVALGGERGADAARLVAVAVLDLARPLPEISASSDRAGEVVAEAPPPPSARSLALGLGVDFTYGATTAGYAPEPSLLLDWTFAPLSRTGRAKLGLDAELGYVEGRARLGNSEPLVVRMLPLRLGVAAVFDRYLLAGGAFVRPYFTSGWGSDNGVQGGGYLTWAVHLPVPGPLSLLLALGLDWPTDTIEFYSNPQLVLATGTLVPWLRVGISWRAL